MSGNFDTSIALKKKWFEKVKSFEKIVHIDKSLHGLKAYHGDQYARFMNGYNPENGSVIRRVKFIEKRQVKHLALEILDMACVDSEWVKSYADLDENVFLYFLQEDENDEEVSR